MISGAKLLLAVGLWKLLYAFVRIAAIGKYDYSGDENVFS